MMKKSLLLLLFLSFFSVYTSAQELNYCEVDNSGKFTNIHFVLDYNNKQFSQYNDYVSTNRILFSIYDFNTWEDKDTRYTKYKCTSTKGNADVTIEQAKEVEFAVIVIEFAHKKLKYIVKLM